MAGDRKFYMQKGSTYIEKQVNFVQGNQVFGRETDAAGEADREMTDDRLRDLINMIMPKITKNRLWFCVGKVLMLRGVIPYDDFEALKELLDRIYPAGYPQSKFEPSDLRKLHDGSFRLPMKDWELLSSPFDRQAEFKAYYNLATEFDALFDQ